MSQGREISGGDYMLNRVGRLTLANQFLLASSLVLLLGMGLIGYWVTQKIETSTTRNAATKTANLINSKVAPLAQELARSESLSRGSLRALEELTSLGDFGNSVSAFKLWRRDGLIVYGSEPETAGPNDPTSEKLTDALSGQLVYSYGEIVDSLDGQPLMEIFSPIRLPWSGEVIGVAEYHMRIANLAEELNQALLLSWLVVGSVTVLMISLLYSIVWKGSRLIETQQFELAVRERKLADRGKELERRGQQLHEALQQSERLRERVRTASARASELNEQLMRRISAELHDGPTQLLAYASLRLDRLKGEPAKDAESAEGGESNELPKVRDSIGSAIRQIRLISRGLAQPELANAQPVKVLRLATAEHERNTDSQVTLDLPHSLPKISLAAKICIYRFAQETLNNAFRHGGGVDQRLSCRVDGEQLVVSVSDKGPGFSDDALADVDRLGLRGLRERVVSLGGRFEIDSGPGEGATLTMWLDLSADDEYGTSETAAVGGE